MNNNIISVKKLRKNFSKGKIVILGLIGTERATKVYYGDLPS